MPREVGWPRLWIRAFDLETTPRDALADVTTGGFAIEQNRCVFEDTEDTVGEDVGFARVLRSLRVSSNLINRSLDLLDDASLRADRRVTFPGSSPPLFDSITRVEPFHGGDSWLVNRQGEGHG
uniref:Recep_L_domain domain-containing protein n=1 Tax=Steinernema glaseri TaxID=37863 RepID=A0A1I7ZJP8_9BILA